MPDSLYRTPTLIGNVSEILSRCTDLVEKEIRLAKAEIAENISAQLTAGAWIGAALLSGFLAVLLVTEGIVFVLTRAGIPAYWACFIMAIAIAIAAALFYVKGKASAKQLFPTKTMRNLNQDLKTAKEQLS